jgi:hypothetical protein
MVDLPASLVNAVMPLSKDSFTASKQVRPTTGLGRNLPVARLL